MVRKVFYLLVISIFLITSSCSDKNVKINEAEKLLTKYMMEGETQGVALTLSIKDEIIWSKGYGLANLEQQTEVFPSKTRFRIGSISKALTAAGLGILMSQNKIDVDLPVTDYLPDYPEKKWPFSIRQLAGHLAGIRHYKGEEFFIKDHYDTVSEGLEIFINDSLIHEPGTKYSYSSHGFNLLSAVIEKVSGTEFLKFMRKNVLEPANLNQTVADLKDTIIIYRSGFYSMDKGRIINAPYVDNSYKWAGGGYLSTSEDIVKFGNAMMYDRLFPDSIKSELISTQFTESGDTTHYGMGWSSGVNKYGRFHYGHGGGSVGGSCQLLVFPAEQLVVAYLTNDSRSDIGKGIHDIVEIFLRKD